MHLGLQITRNIEIGCVRRTEWDVEIVKTAGGNEVRNARWSEPLRAYDVALPTCSQDDRATFDEVMDLWIESEGGAHTFDIYDWVDDELVKVRFDSPPQVTSEAGHLLHMDTFTLQEVRD